MRKLGEHHEVADRTVQHRSRDERSFFDTDKAARLIELIAHLTGIAVDDLDAVCFVA